MGTGWKDQPVPKHFWQTKKISRHPVAGAQPRAPAAGTRARSFASSPSPLLLPCSELLVQAAAPAAALGPAPPLAAVPPRTAVLAPLLGRRLPFTARAAATAQGHARPVPVGCAAAQRRWEKRGRGGGTRQDCHRTRRRPPEGRKPARAAGRHGRRLRRATATPDPPRAAAAPTEMARRRAAPREPGERHSGERGHLPSPSPPPSSLPPPRRSGRPRSAAPAPRSRGTTAGAAAAVRRPQIPPPLHLAAVAALDPASRKLPAARPERRSTSRKLPAARGRRRAPSSGAGRACTPP